MFQQTQSLSLMFSIASILSVFRQNPKLRVAIFVALAAGGVALYGRSIVKKKNQLRVEVDFLKADTTKKYFEILRLRNDTSFYIKGLREAKTKVDSLEAKDSKSNPGLVKELPSIDKLKRK